MVLVHTMFIVAGLVMLVKGADIFVDSVARVARMYNVSEFVIGLTLVAIGTSIPELANSIMASFLQQSGIVIGNVTGANVSNVTLIVGVAAVVAGVAADEDVVRRDAYATLFATLLFYLFALDGSISMLEGMIFVLLEFSYIVFLLEAKSDLEKKYHFKEFITDFFKFTYVKKGGKKILSDIGKSRRSRESPSDDLQPEKALRLECNIRKELLMIALGIVVISLGANLLVDGIIYIANVFGVSETLIAMTLVSFGTTLPELSVTLSAARKNYMDIAIGNVLGSVISNFLLIVGVAALINPLSIATSTLFFTTPFLLLTIILLIVFIKSQWRITRAEGVALLAMYGAFMVISIIVF